MESPKKILDNPILGSLVLPIAIILIAGLIIFGASKLLFTERTYKDLVTEMRSKTFGNRWVAAFELSKLLASSTIPQDEIPALVEELTEIYKTTDDLRTKDFLIVAVGTLKSDSSLPLLAYALEKEKDPNILFHAIISLGNMPPGIHFDFRNLIGFLDSPDTALNQAAILALASHRVAEAYPKIETFLSSQEKPLRYSSAISLIHLKNPKVIPVINELFDLQSLKGFSADQLNGLKLNALNEIQKINWEEFKNKIIDLSHNNQNLVIKTKALEFLNQLNN
jgi:HEAT repeat protein